jgi:hypothetical protein
MGVEKDNILASANKNEIARLAKSTGKNILKVNVL